MSRQDDLNDADIKAAEPIALVKIAAAAQAVTGVLVGLTGLQMLGVHGYGNLEWIEIVPYLLMVFGAAQLGVATMVFRARVWAAIGGAVLSTFIAIAMAGWDVLCVMEEMFSCLALIAFPIAFLATILAFLAIGPVRFTAAARARLSSQGMGLGL